MTQRVEEVLRYLGAGKPPDAASDGAREQLRAQAQRALTQLDGSLVPRQAYRVLTVQRNAAGEMALLDAASRPVLTLPGQLAQTMLQDCRLAAVMVCTLGEAFDGLLRTAQARSMAEAAVLDACGNVLVEETCDRVEQALRERFPDWYLTDRFSPGYGDLPLCVQPELVQLLQFQRPMGIQVTASFLLNPQKTVTAIVGLSTEPQRAHIRGCDHCSLRESCSLRKDGKHCV